ncbi:MAG: DUF3306 domain-containing protein [Pseudolabrys sp.]
MWDAGLEFLMMNNPDESLLLRWSRRKTQARSEARREAVQEKNIESAAPDASAADAAPVERTDSSPAATESVGEGDTPEVDIESLPDVETLTYDSDFSVFLREGVPERLKQAALRKLWLSNPVFANLDGLNDYDPQTMKFLEEAVAEPIAEVGRALRDKIMDVKRAREERPRGRHGPSKQERRASLEQARGAAPAEPAASDEDDDDVGAGDLGPPDERRDN